MLNIYQIKCRFWVVVEVYWSESTQKSWKFRATLNIKRCWNVMWQTETEIVKGHLKVLSEFNVCEAMVEGVEAQEVWKVFGFLLTFCI